MTGFLGMLGRWRRSTSGNVAIISALLLPAIVGFCGLGAETGYWYFRQRDIQAAADISAYDAAVVLRGGASTNTVRTTATTDAGTNGWRTASGTITVNTPPVTGSHQNTRSVEVLLTESQTRYFTAIFNSRPLTINVRAVATYNTSGPACFLGLDPSLSGTIQFWGNATANFADCNIVSNSLADDSFKLGGSANVSAPCVQAAGGSSVTATLTLTSCGSVATHAAQTPDPYSSLAAPPIPGSCTTPPNSGPMSPGKYCSGLTLQGDVTLNPGVYVIDGGPFKVNANANITGTGVTFFLRNGATVQFNGNSHITISAPTSGTYSGILMYGDRSQAFATNTLNGNNSSQMTGAVYFPSQEVDFLGNFSGNNGCLQLVADRIYYTGNGTFHTDCTGDGVTTINTVGSVALAE